MEKEKVLKFKIIKINDFGIAGVLEQNTKILKRSTDTEYSRGYNFPTWDFINKILYTYGDEKYDNLIFTVPKEDFDLFLNKINSINEKYGIRKRWRAEEGEYYYYISLDFGIIKTKSYSNDDFDNQRYELGNYFKIEAEVQKVKEELDKFWAKVRAGEIGGDKNDF